MGGWKKDKRQSAVVGAQHNTPPIRREEPSWKRSVRATVRGTQGYDNQRALLGTNGRTGDGDEKQESLAALRPCCREALGDLEQVREAGRILKAVTGVASFLPMIGANPIDAFLSVVTFDASLVRQALTAVDVIALKRMSDVCLMECLNHAGGSRAYDREAARFWERLAEVFQQALPLAGRKDTDEPEKKPAGSGASVLPTSPPTTVSAETPRGSDAELNAEMERLYEETYQTHREMYLKGGVDPRQADEWAAQVAADVTWKAARKAQP